MGLFRVLIYGIILGVYASALFYDLRFMPRLGVVWWVEKLVMLSMLNLTLQSFYALLCFVCALFDWNEEFVHGEQRKKVKAAHVPSYWRRSRLHRICDFVYATAAFPVGMVGGRDFFEIFNLEFFGYSMMEASCLMFWALYVADPDLVMPAWVAKLVPNWLNHVSHTAPVAFVLVDTLLTCHHAPDRKVGSAVVAALFFCYVGIIFAARFLNGVWLYPIFDRLSNQQIAGLFSTAGALFWFLYLIGDGLNMALWGKAPHSVDDGIKQQQTGKKLRAD